MSWALDPPHITQAARTGFGGGTGGKEPADASGGSEGLDSALAAAAAAGAVAARLESEESRKRRPEALAIAAAVSAPGLFRCCVCSSRTLPPPFVLPGCRLEKVAFAFRQLAEFLDPGA